MKIIITRHDKGERVIDVNDATMYVADSKYIIATYCGEKWFVKDRRAEYRASLKALHEHSGGAFVFLDRDKLVRRDQIVGRRNYMTRLPLMAVLQDGQAIRIGRRRRKEFNRLYVKSNH